MKAFTLVELLIVTLLLGMITAGVVTVLNVGNAAYYADLGMLGLQQQVRQCLNWLEREVRASSSLAITTEDANSDRVVFTTPNKFAVQYYRDRIDSNGDGITNQVIREYPFGTRRVIANDISRLKFSQSGGILQIQIQGDTMALGKAESFTLTEKVRLRNE
ncbi:MAG: hypothetical protein Q8N85_02495 [Candidatus Omnitrophota bacterium]|nr:hypothetical protein [Candidatus Omnitrophota bacterium]